jgi:DNA-binding Lrp family transcriptional regulator
MEKLLAILEQNARTPIDSIAKQLNLTLAEAEAALTRLEQEGVVLAYTTIIDQEKAQRTTVKAVIEVKVTPEGGGGFDRLANRIAQHEVVTSCYLMSGNYDLLLLVEGTNSSIAQFVSEKLSAIPGVVSTRTHFTLKPYKIEGVLLKKESEDQRLSISP